MTWPRAFVVVAISLIAFTALWLPNARRALDPHVPDQAADFPNYYFGGERFLDGRDVYEGLGPEVEQLFGITGYDTYPADPPATVVVFSPLSLLAYETAWRLWQAISAALVFGSVVVVAREVGYSPPTATAMAGVAFVTLPVRFLLERNHMESVLLVLGVLGWRALRRGAGRRGAVLWGAAAGLKLFPGMWLVGIAGRDRRLFYRGMSVALSMIVIGGAMLGPSNVVQFVRDVVPSSRQWSGTLGNYSLVSAGTALAGTWLGWLLLTAAIVLLVPRYLGGRSGPDQVYVSGTALALLLSPLAWLNYFVLVIPALVILSCSFDLRDNARHRFGLAVLVLALLFWGPVVTDTEIVSEALSFVPTYALIVLFFVAQNRIKEATWPSTSAIQPRSLS